MDELGAENPVALKDVIHKDKDLYVEVCESFVDLYQVAVKLLDDKGNRLLDFPGRSDLCQYIYNFETCRQACVNIVGGIRRSEPTFQTVETNHCFSGAQYRTVPIHNATDVIGKVVFGPFLPSDVKGPPREFLAMDPRLDPQTAWQTTQRFRRIHPDLAEKVARNLATVIEVMSFVGIKGQMTTDMHVESITEAYAALEGKNKQLSDSVDQLKTLNDQRSNFLSHVTSQLRSPLTHLIGYAEMMYEGVGGDITEDQEEFLGTIIENGEKVMHITRTMDELSRIERGHIEVLPEPMPLDESLTEVLEYGRRLGHTQEVEVELFPLAPDLPMVSADEHKLASILRHVVHNAVKFTPAGGRVILSATGPDDESAERPIPPGFVAISVIDTG
ncbi:MAG: PocR ligand-binding domain-containing protein, partial [Myxococcales bacterium]|nr:PocR ligand-binding domain-containing protein [Myxococcales bacterium]